MTPELEDLIKRSKLLVDGMSAEEKEQMLRAQRDSWVRSIADWPKAKYKWINGVKVYDSFEDYCND